VVVLLEMQDQLQKWLWKMILNQDEILTVFAGFHSEATNQVRKYCLPYPSIVS
jgi:hypothetical protein